MPKKKWKPNFSDCVTSEEQILSAQLNSIRAAISHPGEKGSSLEIHVREFLRSFLPGEYGISSGFIAYHDNCVGGTAKNPKYLPQKDIIRLSTQLDVIIYDALRFGPIMSLGSADVFPLEAVYAYMEVKSKIESTAMLKKLLVQSRSIRKMQTKFYQVPVDNTYTKTALAVGSELISTRSFAFALGASDSLGDHNEISRKIESKIQETKGFLSGMYIQDKGYFRSHHSETEDDPLNGTVESVGQDNALLQFKMALLAALSRFPRIDKNDF